MPYREHLGDGLILRTVRNEGDIARFVALNEAVTNEGSICDRLLHHHPETGSDDYLLVEDEHTGEVVSTTCLLPWRCTYEDVGLRVAMLEMVATHPNYRHRGLVRAQVMRFHQVVDARRFDLCIVQGIPYYYRQYGYAYALDHTPGVVLPTTLIPDRSTGDGDAYQRRQATPSDAVVLAELYRKSMTRCQVHVQRQPGYWRYLLQYAPYPVQVVTDGRTDAIVGYLGVRRHADGQPVQITESSLPSRECGLAALHLLVTNPSGEITVGGSSAHTLVRLARSLGSTPLPSGQWLLRLVNPAAFLAKIGPVLERRLGSSDCVDLTADLCLNLYRHAFRLCFRNGRLEAVQPVGFVDASIGADGGDLCIPPEAFVRLVFGYRGLDELHDAWPDIVVRPTRKYVLETLFPRMTNWVCIPY